jgi:isopropylmalate/homocitrate/citramalate synthase
MSQLGGTDRTAVSPWNWDGLEGERVRARPPRVADCTLRDGEQQPGIVFTVDQKVEIARAVAGLGVHDLELGTPAVSLDDAEAIRRVVEAELGVYTSALGRATEADVDLVRSCGVDAVRLSLPISERQRAAKMRLPAGQYVERALHIAGYAKQRGLDVIFSPYDTTRCDQALLEALLDAFRREGCVDRVRLVDTTGAASPQAVAALVTLMDEAGGGIPIEVHCHDDFGLGTANTVAGALAGAAYLSTTINGIGERSGNASLEEVVTALAVLYGVDLGIDLAGLTAVSTLVEAASGVRLQPHKAVVGRNAFAHESGLVVAGLLRDPFTAEAYAPELVGQRRRIVVGKTSGRASLEAKVRELVGGDPPDNLDLDALLVDVKAAAIDAGRSLEDDELRALMTTRSKG